MADGGGARRLWMGDGSLPPHFAKCGGWYSSLILICYNMRGFERLRIK